MKIEVLYSECANLYGDLMNVTYLQQSCPDIQVVNTALKEPPRFLTEEIALVYLGSTTEKGQALISAALMPYRTALIQKIEAGQPFLVTGNALEIFGRDITADDGRQVTGLDLFGTQARQKMLARYNSLYLGKFEEADIVGFKSQFGHSYGASGLPPLFETVRGDGLCPGESGEGVRWNHFMATYLIGPLVILNPPFAKYLLRLMGVEQPQLAFEDAAYDAYLQRVAEFQKPETGFLY